MNFQRLENRDLSFLVSHIKRKVTSKNLNRSLLSKIPVKLSIEEKCKTTNDYPTILPLNINIVKRKPLSPILSCNLKFSPDSQKSRINTPKQRLRKSDKHETYPMRLKKHNMNKNLKIAKAKLLESHINHQGIIEYQEMLLKKHDSSSNYINYILEKNKEIDKELKNVGKILIKDVSESLNVKKEVLKNYRKNNSSQMNSPSRKEILLKPVIENSKLEESHGNQYYIPNNTKSNLINNNKNKESFKKDEVYCTKNDNTYTSKKNLIIEKEENDIELVNSSDFIFIINYNGYFRIIIDLISFSSVIYTIIITPIYLSFFPEIGFLKVIESIIELFFLLEIILNYLTTLLDKEENLVTDLNIISKIYTSSWLLLDIISSLPIECINLLVNESFLIFSYKSFYLYLRVISWLKTIRFAKLFKEQTTGRFIRRIFLNYGENICKLCKFFSLFAILVHSSSCFFIYLGKCSINIDNWISNTYFQTDSYFDLYLASVYFNLVTIFSIGYGDITPVNIVEKAWVSFFMMLGSMFYSFTISSLSLIFSEKSKHYLDYKKKMSIINSICQEYKIPDSLYYELLHNTRKEYKKYENDKYEFLECLPANIKNDLMLIMYEETISKNNFFYNTQHDFILYVVSMLKHENVYKGDILISSGDFVEQMYFVMEGYLCINIELQNQIMEIGYVKRYDHYGDLFMHLNERSPYEIKCKRSKTDVLALKKQDFLNLMNTYSSNMFDILDRSANSLINIDRLGDIYNKLITFYKSAKVVKDKVRKLNIFLLNDSFLNMFNNNKETFNLHEFLHGKTEQDIDSILNMLKEKRISNRMSIFSKKFPVILSGKSKGSYKHNESIHSSDQPSYPKFTRNLLEIPNNREINPEEKRTFSFSPISGIHMSSSKKKKMKNEFKSYYHQISKSIESKMKAGIAEREKSLDKKTCKLFSNYKMSVGGLSSMSNDKETSRNGWPKKKLSFQISSFKEKEEALIIPMFDEDMFNFQKINNPKLFKIERTVDISITCPYESNKCEDIEKKLIFKEILPVLTEQFSLIEGKKRNSQYFTKRLHKKEVNLKNTLKNINKRLEYRKNSIIKEEIEVIKLKEASDLRISPFYTHTMADLVEEFISFIVKENNLNSKLDRVIDNLRVNYTNPHKIVNLDRNFERDL